ncbi:tRNA pseudouridine synthase A [Bifidobacterium sp. ESL0784]|uniref:tRNA pseudouridine synthase A n=1 Tax=Bifidobacterium sp. ESL0784 TaxID=2983231 RepID=UPI0023F9A2BC|nr:tRNA pseudouridine synthase A [Bifidobacterium sp. ESL0784]MDF7640464.1 tRNA pseudouridine synthase A [Bifidobacterium sp. ESL0784]
MRLRIDLAYDGGGFHGWAKQPGLRTVQGTVESALQTVLRVPADDAVEPLRLVVAGRTDTGVHAVHQVCHLDVGEQTLQRCVGHMDVSPVEALRRRLVHDLPDDVSLHDVRVAPVGFDARFSALQRTYVYRISDGDRPVDPRLRGFVLNVEDMLDVYAMNEAAAMTLGLHDFGSFATPNPGGTTIREVKQAVWKRVPVTDMFGYVGTEKGTKDIDSNETSSAARETAANNSTNTGYFVPSLESGLVCFMIVADAFAHNMVRSLVNACVQVGRHRKSLEWFAQKMKNPVREGSTGPIAACGLTLEHVAYPAETELASRAASIRARRTLPE